MIKELFAGIKSAIANLDFEYYPAGSWFNVNFGEFPVAAMNKTYTIKISMPNKSVALHGATQMDVSIEFVADAKNDAYLDYIENMYDAIRSLNDVEFDSYGRMIKDSRGNFRTVYIGEFVVVTFDDIHIDIISSTETSTDGFPFKFPMTLG